MGCVLLSGWFFVVGVMILAVDVHYKNGGAMVAGVAFERWWDERPLAEYVSQVEAVVDYESGQFYKRELPCILTLLEAHCLKPNVMVVDGYVYLDGHSRAGLGRYLYEALAGEVVVVGVAKKAFRGIEAGYAVYRGQSRSPLYVTAVGMAVNQAHAAIGRMHGRHRLPTLLKRVDQMCRGF